MTTPEGAWWGSGLVSEICLLLSGMCTYFTKYECKYIKPFLHIWIYFYLFCRLFTYVSWLLFYSQCRPDVNSRSILLISFSVFACHCFCFRGSSRSLRNASTFYILGILKTRSLLQSLKFAMLIGLINK